MVAAAIAAAAEPRPDHPAEDLMAVSDLPRSSDLPAWMCDLRDRFLSTDTSQFVIHGNVHDLVLCANSVWSMPDFLDAFFEPSDKVVVHYDPGRGIWFPNDRHAARAATAWAVTGFLPASKISSRNSTSEAAQRLMARQVDKELGMERRPEVALAAIEHLLLHKTPVAVVVHYCELVAPDGHVSSLGFDDRTAAAQIHRWSLSDEFAKGDNLVLLMTSALPDLSRRITRNPRVGVLQVPLPTAIDRARFLAHTQPGLTPDRGEKLTRVTAGLQLRQIHDLMGSQRASQESVQESFGADARSVFKAQAAVDLPLEAIAERKKAILEQECHGLIEVIQPDHGFDVVGGMEPIKLALNRIAGHVSAGRTRQVPMGILFVGPMGTGKSFLAEAFAKESGLAAIKLKNFRDRWVGSTEANLEKVLNVIEGLGEILVIIDEGDRSLGGGGDSDGGTSSRVMARLKEFMSDPTHRGRIIFVMMTNRPDKLDVDMKRPGRFDLKIPFFPPQTSKERLLILKAVMRRHKIETDFEDAAILPVLEPLEGYAAADLEALALMAYDDVQTGYLPEGVEENPGHVTVEFMAQAVRDFMPTREAEMIAYMELLAVHEASNRRLLPPRFRDIGIGELNRLTAAARERALRR
ncbi:MAG: transitional endoplasmic reticulum ATPase [Bradymonadia bacterium]